MSQISAEKLSAKTHQMQLDGVSIGGNNHNRNKKTQSFIQNVQTNQEIIKHYQSAMQLPTQQSFVNQQQVQQKTIANDKLFLKNISLRNVRQMYNPSHQKSQFMTQSSFNSNNLNSVLQQYESQISKEAMELKLNHNDPFDLMKHKNETIAQILNKQKHNKKSESQSPIRALQNPQKQFATQAEKLSKRQKNLSTMYGNNNSTSSIIKKTQISFANQLPSATVLSPSRNQDNHQRQFSTLQNQPTLATQLQLFTPIHNMPQQKLMTSQTNYPMQTVKCLQQKVVVTSDRNKKKNFSLDNLEKLYSNFRMRSESTDRMSNQELFSNEMIRTQSKVSKNSSRGKKKKLIQNIQNNINLSFTNPLYHDQNHFKVLELDMVKRLASIEDPLSIYLDTITSVSKMLPLAQDLLFKIIQGIREQYSKSKSASKMELSQYQKIIEDLQEQLTLEQSKVATINLEVAQYKKKLQLNEQNLLKKDKMLAQLQVKVEDINKQQRQFLGKYDETKILEEIKVLVNENQELKSAVREVKSEMDYGKQRENKLMYFLFVLQKKGIPIYEIFDQNIKDLPTARFSAELDDQYKQLYFEQQRKLRMRGGNVSNLSVNVKRIKFFDKEINEVPASLNTTESYFPIVSGPIIMPEKPHFIPTLDLRKVEVIQQQRLQQQQEQERMKEQQEQSDDGRPQSDDDDDEGEEFSLGIRSTTRLQDVLRKNKYEQLEGMPLPKGKLHHIKVKMEEQQYLYQQEYDQEDDYDDSQMEVYISPDKNQKLL